MPARDANHPVGSRVQVMFGIFRERELNVKLTTLDAGYECTPFLQREFDMLTNIA